MVCSCAAIAPALASLQRCSATLHHQTSLTCVFWVFRGLDISYPCRRHASRAAVQLLFENFVRHRVFVIARRSPEAALIFMARLAHGTPLGFPSSSIAWLLAKRMVL